MDKVTRDAELLVKKTLSEMATTKKSNLSVTAKKVEDGKRLLASLLELFPELEGYCEVVSERLAKQEEIAKSAHAPKKIDGDQNTTGLKLLLKELNALGGKKWEVDEYGSDEVLDELRSSFEIDPANATVFNFSRQGEDRSELCAVSGAILPDGRVYILIEASDRVSDGNEVWQSVGDWINHAKEVWYY